MISAGGAYYRKDSMYYLSSCNRGLFKGYYCHVLFFGHSKNHSNIMKDISNCISIYLWKKNSLLTNIRNKCVIRKMNLYSFDFLSNGQIFASKVRNCQYYHRFLFGREMWNIRTCKEKRLQKLIKFGLSRYYLFWHLSNCL